MVRQEIQLCWKKEGPRWIGSGACNLIVIACRSLVNASRHLRQTTYVGPLHNARDQDGGEGHQPPTLSSHAFRGRYNMLHWNTSSQNAHVMGLQVFWLMALDFLGVWIDHAFILVIPFQAKKKMFLILHYNCASFPWNWAVCVINIVRITNAVQVTPWLSITNPQCHD